MRQLVVVWMLLALAGTAHAGPDEMPGPEVVHEVMSHEDELLELIEKNDPEHHARLLRLKAVDRPAYVFALLRVAKMVQRAQADPSFAERARAIRERERRLEQLAKDFGDLDRGERKARRAELEQVAGELMDLKQEERRARLEEMRERIAEFERDIEAREQDRDPIIDAYVEQLLQEPVEL